MTPADKWHINLKKVALLQSFPGLMTDWSQAHGRQLEASLPFPGHKSYATLVFTGGHFGVSSTLQSEPQLLTQGLQLARPLLEPHQPDSFKAYDRLHALDRHIGHQIRMNNIINAITHNIASMPELKSRIRDLVRQWES